MTQALSLKPLRYADIDKSANASAKSGHVWTINYFQKGFMIVVIRVLRFLAVLILIAVTLK